eukprot:1983484-Heterocapsa_arctica.AAC.1
MRASVHAAPPGVEEALAPMPRQSRAEACPPDSTRCRGGVCPHAKAELGGGLPPRLCREGGAIRSSGVLEE